MLNAFLLTRQWRDTRDGVALDFWWATEQGACWTQITGQEIVFFTLRQHAQKIQKIFSSLRAWRMAEVELKSFHNHSVNALYFKSQRSARDAQDILKNEGLEFWEADIRPHERYLMERFITAGALIDISEVDSRKPILNPRLSPSDVRHPLKMVSLDIETTMDAKQLFSIAVWGEQAAKVFIVGDAAERKNSAADHGPIHQRFRQQICHLADDQHFAVGFGHFDGHGSPDSDHDTGIAAYCQNPRC